MVQGSTRPTPNLPSGPSGCTVETHKTPSLPHLPPKPVHPVTVHWQPNRRPAAPPAVPKDKKPEDRQSDDSENNMEVEPEFFGHELASGNLVPQPCTEEPVSSDTAKPSSHQGNNQGHHQEQHQGHHQGGHHQGHHASRPTVSALPIVTHTSSSNKPLQATTTEAPATTTDGATETYTGGYVLNLAGPQHDDVDDVDNARQARAIQPARGPESPEDLGGLEGKRYEAAWR